MAYRSAPPDTSQPVYHGSAFPWDVVETAGAIHVGDHAQASDMIPRKPNPKMVSDALGGAKSYDNSKNQNGGGPAVTLRKGGAGSGTGAEAANWDSNQPTVRTRSFRAPPEAPNGGITELNFNPGVGFHDVDLSDRAANTAHLAHSREADYPRGGSIDESSWDWDQATLQKFTTTPPEPGVTRTGALRDAYGATQALRENKVLRYANTIEGDGQGISYVVPNPDLNLRQYGEDPKPVAGKEYHQTPLPGIDLAAVKNPGPFHDEFNDGGPDHFGLGDVRKPNLSRTRRRNQTATDSNRPRDFKDEPLF